MTIETFLTHWESKSTAHETRKHIRTHGKLEVAMYQSGRDNNTVRLSSIRSTKPRKGEATKFLKWLNNQADKHQFKVTSVIQTFGWNRDSGPDKEKIKVWAEKYGYKVREDYPEEWGFEMIREPRSAKSKKK